jgi:hypothetical protein
VKNEPASKSDDGGPAFPVLYGQTNGADGMTMRDWFAGHAMAAAYASFAEWRDARAAAQGIADESYLIADAMLRARAKR